MAQSFTNDVQGRTNVAVAGCKGAGFYIARRAPRGEILAISTAYTPRLIAKTLSLSTNKPEKHKFRRSWPVSRVLYNRSCDNHSSRMCIAAHLKQPTQKQHGPRLSFSIWSCSRWGLPCRKLLPVTRCALTAPFHPYLEIIEAVSFCCTSRRFSPPRRYLAPCPVEPGLSSLPTFFNESLHSDCPANFRSDYNTVAQNCGTGQIKPLVRFSKQFTNFID